VRSLFGSTQSAGRHFRAPLQLRQTQPLGTDGKITSTQPQEIQASSFDQAAEKAFGKGVVQDPSRGALVGTISRIDSEGRRKFRQYFRP
jgi:hypothetical protein